MSKTIKRFNRLSQWLTIAFKAFSALQSYTSQTPLGQQQKLVLLRTLEHNNNNG